MQSNMHKNLKKNASVCITSKIIHTKNNNIVILMLKKVIVTLNAMLGILVRILILLRAITKKVQRMTQ